MTIHELDKHLFEEAKKIVDNLHDKNLTHNNIKLLADIATLQMWLRHPEIKAHFVKHKHHDAHHHVESQQPSESYFNESQKLDYSSL